MIKGCIFNIQKFCLHDGPGIRTVIFMKGCPLHCRWCSNPESQSGKKEIIYDAKLCIGCGGCVAVCPIAAVTVTRDKRVSIDRDRCNKCGVCSTQCPTTALQILGKEMTAKEILNIVEADRLFYQTSGGGVTISGGEPLFQPEFLFDLLKQLKENEINTAMETSGIAPWDVIKELCKLLDWVLFDIKHLDRKKHLESTGVNNDQIIDNLSKLSAIKKNLILRIPVIPGFNMDHDFYDKIIKIVNNENINFVDLLTYHRLGSDKYEKLGKKYELINVNPPNMSLVDEVAHMIARQTNAKVSVNT